MSDTGPPTTSADSSVSGSLISDMTTTLLFLSSELPSENVTLLSTIYRRSKKHEYPLLSLFLSECLEVLKSEIVLLPPSLRQLLQPWQNISALATQYAELRYGPLGSALKGVLLSTLQIASIIGYHEEQGLSHLFNQGSAILSGLGIGLISTVAVATSSSLAELALGGAESVRVAFRFALHVDRVSQSLEPRDIEGRPGSWAYAVTGLSAQDVQKELDQFNKVTGCPELSKLFVSSSDETSVSVSGPPSRLDKAFRFSHVLRYSRYIQLPIYGICHASHLYHSSDVNSILHTSKSKRASTRQTQLHILSTTDGTPYIARTADELYGDVLFDILARPNSFGDLADGVRDTLSLSTHCDFLQFGKSILSNSLVTAIEGRLPDLKLTTQELGTWLAREDLVYQPASHKDSKLAIVGMSCRLPGGANDTELFWKLMVDGRDVHTEVPADRFDLSTHYDPSGEIPNTTETPYGNFIDRPGFFDASFFNMSPREAEQTDPMHRLALVTAYEALEMAGYAPNRTPSTTLKRIGTFYGQASDDWREANAGQYHGTYAVPGGVRAFANGRINYFFKFGGPSFNIDTACSSGLAAVQAACSALWAGESDMVLAGGLNVITNPETFSMLCKGYFLSKTGQCKVWDNSADGYCRADGIGSVVIKRLEDAEADNDNILAVISAAATNHSAEAISITHPHAGAQIDNYRQVMRAAGVNPLDVGYIELHGTGTQSGDAVESESVASVFAPLLWPRKPEQRLHLGAVKSNIGHSGAAAGIASLLKTLLIMQKGVIPPHIGIVTEVNPVVARNLDRRNAGLVLKSTPWPRPAGGKRHAVVNSFGAHGGNTTLLLEDAPVRPRVGADPRRTHVVTLSAKSKASLRGNAEALLEFLEAHPDTDVGDLSYTLCARRIHHSMRLTTTASSIDELRGFLSGAMNAADDVRPVLSTPPRIAFVFAGQGIFYEGMSAQLFQHFPFYRTEILQLDGLVQQLGFPSIVPRVEAIGGSDVAVKGISPVESQLAILVIEIALSRFWQYLGVVPSVVIGHSLGEYAALVVAGVLSAVDAIFLVGRRAQLMMEACESGSCAMLSVRASVDNITDAVGNAPFEVSCLNGPLDTVISGQRSDIEAIRTILNSKGFKCMMLDVPFAFHTRQMEPLLEAYEEVARHITFKAPQLPVLSPLLGDVVFDDKAINSEYLSRATREPVDFIGALQSARDLDIIGDQTIWIDIGPHAFCGAFVQSVLSSATRIVPSLRRNEDDFTALAAALASLHHEGVPVEWNEYFQPYERAHRLLHLPAYRWNEKNYWIQYEGTWTLDKAYPPGKNPRNELQGLATPSLRTSSVQRVISEEVIDESRARLTAQSDLWHPSLLPTLQKHRMNGYPAVTTVVWVDAAYTVGEHLYRLLVPGASSVSMNVSQMEILHAQVIPNQDTGKARIIHIEAEADLTTRSTVVRFYTISKDDGTPDEEVFASTTIRYEDSEAWKREWSRTEFLIKARIDDLTRQAADGSISRLSRGLVYELLRNIVDLEDDYRGMQSVLLADSEAFASVTLSQDKLGTWHTPPHWFDSVLQVGAVICNGSESFNPRDYFYVPYYWSECRMLGRLEPGAQLQSYMRISPVEEHIVGGDVYILQDGALVGMMTELKFRRVPGILMGRFFSPSSGDGHTMNRTSSSKRTETGKAIVPPTMKPHPPITSSPPVNAPLQPSAAVQRMPPAESHSNNASTQQSNNDNPTIEQCLQLIARETGIERSSLSDEASFMELGVDSLMSLVLSEKLRIELGMEIKNTVFLECPIVAELKEWLSENY